MISQKSPIIIIGMARLFCGIVSSIVIYFSCRIVYIIINSILDTYSMVGSIHDNLVLLSCALGFLFAKTIDVQNIIDECTDECTDKDTHEGASTKSDKNKSPIIDVSRRATCNRQGVSPSSAPSFSSDVSTATNNGTEDTAKYKEWTIVETKKFDDGITIETCKFNKNNEINAKVYSKNGAITKIVSVYPKYSDYGFMEYEGIDMNEYTENVKYVAHLIGLI